MAVYLGGYALTGAQGGAEGFLQSYRAAQTQTRQYLFDTLQMPYFRAFREDRQSLQALCVQIEGHIVQALAAAESRKRICAA